MRSKSFLLTYLLACLPACLLKKGKCGDVYGFTSSYMYEQHTTQEYANDKAETKFNNERVLKGAKQLTHKLYQERRNQHKIQFTLYSIFKSTQIH
jgi:hypothetical protein